jgi:hypothetical protein
MKIKLILLLAIICLAGEFSRAQKSSEPFADFYVSTKGNDSWSGKLSEPNTEKNDGPFATVRRAKMAVRLMKMECYRNVHVLIRGGEYYLSEKETFTPADSHYDSYKVFYMAWPGENPSKWGTNQS